MVVMPYRLLYCDATIARERAGDGGIYVSMMRKLTNNLHKAVAKMRLSTIIVILLLVMATTLSGYCLGAKQLPPEAVLR